MLFNFDVTALRGLGVGNTTFLLRQTENQPSIQNVRICAGIISTNIL